MAQRVAFLIGNQKFLPESGLLPLQGPANDIASFARLLRDPERGKFDNVYEFLDKPGYEILPNIERTLSAAAKEDLFLMFYSGHGKLGRNGRLYLATADTRGDALLTSSIPARHLSDLVEEADCGQVVLLLDCCYSGAVDAGLRGDVSSELQVIENAQGFYIMTATTSTESARETELMPGGTVMGRFTAALVNAIESGAADLGRKGRILLSDLRHHLGHVVAGQTPQFFDRRASGDPLISFSPATAAPLLDAELLADLDAEQWHRRRGAVSALSDILQDGDAATRAAARAALQLRLRKERDYIVRTELESALGLKNVSAPDPPRAAPAAETSTPPMVEVALSAVARKSEVERTGPRDEAAADATAPPPDFDPGTAQTIILRGEAPPPLWRPSIKELELSFHLTGAQVSDASPLAGLTALKSLHLTGTQVSDLSPLAGLAALEYLDLDRTQVSGVSPLAGLTALQNLNLGRTQVSDVSPLANLTALKSLTLIATQVSDVSPLAGLTALEYLNLDRTQVGDVSPLAGLTALEYLDLYSTQVSDVSPLAGLTALEYLNLDRTQVSDVSPLAGLTALKSLHLTGTQVSDVAPLAGLAALKYLDLDGTQVSGVSPLAGLTALQNLNLDRTQVSDLSPLAGLTALKSLHLIGTQVSDVSPLAGLTALEYLHLRGTQVSDVSPLAHIRGLKILGLQKS